MVGKLASECILKGRLQITGARAGGVKILRCGKEGVAVAGLGAKSRERKSGLGRAGAETEISWFGSTALVW